MDINDFTMQNKNKYKQFALVNPPVDMVISTKAGVNNKCLHLLFKEIIFILLNERCLFNYENTTQF
jgi:hypothetical protein